MPASSYRLETVPSTALVLGIDSWLVSQFTLELEGRGFVVYRDPAALPPDTELDLTLVVDLPPSNPPNLSALPPSADLFYLASASAPPAKLPPRARPLLTPDVFGPHFTHAPTLVSLLDSAMGQGTLTLPGDGLAAYPLITDQDLVTGTLASLSGHSSRFLAGGELSLLSLAHLLRANLAHPTKLIFGPSLAPTLASPPNYPPPPGWRPASDLQSALTAFIKSYQPDSTVTLPPPTSRPPDQPTHRLTDSLTRPDLARISRSAGPHPRLSRLSDLVSKASSLKPVGANHASAASQEITFVPLPRERRLRPRPSLRHLFSRLHRPRLPRPLTILTTGLFLGFALYLLVLVASLTVTALTLRAYAPLVDQSTLPSRASLKTARLPAVFLEANLVALCSLPGLNTNPSFTTIAALTTSYRLSLDTLLLGHDLAATSGELLRHILGSSDQDTDLAGLLSVARLQSGELYQQLSLLDGSLPPDPPAPLPPRFHSTYNSLKSSLMTLRRHTLTARTLLSVAPDFLGVGDRRKYLVLFQNNMELRATGGFIGSFGLLNFENGVLFDFPIYDVYQADGQLKGHVEPPAEIKEYLGEANWYLRDSNWDPDFPTSARRAEWFLGKTLGEEVQGTLAVNVNTLAAVLKALGPVSLPDYDEQVSSDNIFERAEYHSEVNFFPGSQQKKEFLSAVADALFGELNSLDSSRALPLARAFLGSLDEKDTLLAVESDTTNHVFATLGWNGELRSLPCAVTGSAGSFPNCYLDFAMLVDSNFGVNKANFFLRRTLALDVTISPDLHLSHRLSATYQNTADSASWPAGPYKSYSRLYLPEGAILDSVVVDGQTLPEEGVSLSAAHGRTVVGYLLEVPIGSTVKLEINYRLSSRLPQDQPVYSLFWQKQSGTAADPLTITLDYPSSLKPLVVSPAAGVGDQELEFNLSNITDRRVTVQFE